MSQNCDIIPVVTKPNIVHIFCNTHFNIIIPGSSFPWTSTTKRLFFPYIFDSKANQKSVYPVMNLLNPLHVTRTYFPKISLIL